MAEFDKTRAVYGIDLGTTYSCIAQMDKFDQAVVLTNFDGSQLVGKTVSEYRIGIATNNATKIDTARTSLGERYEVRSLLQIGCDTRKEFYSVILGQEARKRLSFVKRFFGFDTFYMAKDGKVTLVEGKYTVAEYSFTEFASLEDMRQYLDKQKKDDAQ